MEEPLARADPAETTNPDLDGLVGDLRRLYAEGGTRLSIAIGRLIIERLYDGDFCGDDSPLDDLVRQGMVRRHDSVAGHV